MKPLLILLLVLSTSALGQSRSASKYRLLSLEDFSISYAQFDHHRDPYVPERDDWLYRASTDFNISVLHTIYWHNNVHTEAVRSGSVKTVGWHWVLGLRVNKYMDLFHEHHSRHVMEEDRESVNGKNVFPVEDSYGIKFKIVEDGAMKKSLGGWLFK